MKQMDMKDVRERVRRSNDIIDIISGYLQLRKAGSNHKGLCPFHSEKTPSMVVNSEKQIFHCFGCGAGGDVFTFVSMIENLSFFESLEKLGKRAGIPVRASEPLSPEFKLKNRILELNKKAALYFSSYLINTLEGKKGLSYLKNRGIASDTLEKFSLGYAGSAFLGLGNYLKQDGYSFEFQEEAGVLRKNDQGRYSDRFRNRVVFPIQDLSGDIVGFGGRVIETSLNRPKYLNSPETGVYKKSDTLFGLNFAKDFIKKSASVIMVEGYMDLIPLHQAGIKNVIATCGTSLTESHVKLLKRFTDQTIMVFDGDSAGGKATVRGYELLNKGGVKVKIINLPKGKDPDDFLKEEGAETFLKLAEDAENFLDYIIHKSLAENSNSTVEGKVDCVNTVLPYLKLATNAIEQGFYVSKLAGALKISEKSIYQELDKRGKEAHIDGQKSGTVAFHTRFKAEEGLLRVMLTDFSKIEVVRRRVSPEEFQDKVISEIVDVLFREAGSEQVEASDLMNLVRTGEARRVVSEYVTSDSQIDITDEYIDDCVRDMKRMRENLPGFWKMKNSCRDRQRCLKEQLKEINKVDTGNLIH